MMMDTVGKPHPLQISAETMKVLIVGQSTFLDKLINNLQELPYLEVVLAHLVKSDVTSPECSLGEIIDIEFLA